MKQYFNDNDKTIRLEQLSITNEAEPDFELDSETDTSIDSLPSNSEVKLLGTFKPKTAGKYSLEAKFDYAEGEEVRAVAEITVIQTSLLPIVVDGLPDEVVTNSLHEVQLLVNNKGEFAETLLNIEPGNLLSETITIELNRKTYTLEQFNALAESEKILIKNRQIKIKGRFKAGATEGLQTLGVKVNYKVGEDESAYISWDKLEGGFTNVISKEKANIIVTGTVKPKEKSMRLGGEEAIEFTFENTNDKYPATGVAITITSTAPGRDEISEVKKN